MLSGIRIRSFPSAIMGNGAIKRLCETGGRRHFSRHFSRQFSRPSLREGEIRRSFVMSSFLELTLLDGHPPHDWAVAFLTVLRDLKGCSASV
jgi:hypothetical protein